MKSSLTEKWIVCRVCLKQPKEVMQTIFDKNADKDLTQMIFECGGVPIKQYDHFPDKICSKCLRYLRVAYKFRVSCQRSHKHLSRFMAPVVIVEKTDADALIVEEVIEGEHEIMPDLTVELDEAEAEEIALKLEPEDAMGIKQELSEDEEIMEMYEPMDEEGEDEDVVLDEIDTNERSASANSEDIEYLVDFVEDEFTSDEEFLPNASKMAAAKKAKAKVAPKLTAKRSPSQKQSATSRLTMQRAPRVPKGVKKEPKAKKFKEKSFICDMCGNIYPSQGRLTEHIKLHQGIKPHECEICGHCFAQTQQLARHMNTHTGNRPYKCNYCPSAFADLSTRNKHHRIHTNERPYVCDVCGKAFTYTNTLKFHKMIHTGEKPHICDVCGKGFQQAYKLRNHKLTHEKRGVKLERIEVETLNSYQDVTVDAAQIIEI